MNTDLAALPPSLAAHIRHGSPLHTKEDPNTLVTLTRGFEQHAEAVKDRLTKSERDLSGINQRLTDLEKKDARRCDDGDNGLGSSLGSQVAENDGVRSMSSDFRGKTSVILNRKAITSAPATVGNSTRECPHNGVHGFGLI